MATALRGRHVGICSSGGEVSVWQGVIQTAADSHWRWNFGEFGDVLLETFSVLSTIGGEEFDVDDRRVHRRGGRSRGRPTCLVRVKTTRATARLFHRTSAH